MQQTEKYQFNLIETSDAFGPEALNENAEAVERELLAVRSELAAAGAADKAELQAAAAADKAELQTAIQKAQSVADSAYKPGQLPYATGYYHGGGDTPITIELGFKPSFLIIDGCVSTNTSSDIGLYAYRGCACSAYIYSTLTFSNTGFTVTYKANDYPILNQNNRLYRYIAIR